MSETDTQIYMWYLSEFSYFSYENKTKQNKKLKLTSITGTFSSLEHGANFTWHRHIQHFMPLFNAFLMITFTVTLYESILTKLSYSSSDWSQRAAGSAPWTEEKQ